MKKMPDVWVFDICGTLFSSNTTFDFLEYYFERHDAKGLNKLKGIRKKNAIYWFRAVLFKFLHIDIYKKKAVSLLKGHDVTQVEEEATVFMGEVLRNKLIAKTNQMLSNSISGKSKIYLASNSIEPVVKAIANYYGLEYLSTTLAIESGKYTGNITQDMTGVKHKFLTPLIGHYGFAVVTDNKSDHELIRIAENKFVVIEKEADRKFWNKFDPEFIINE